MLGFLVIILCMEAKFSVLVTCYVKSILRSWSYDYLGKYFRYMSTLISVTMLLFDIKYLFKCLEHQGLKMHHLS